MLQPPNHVGHATPDTGVLLLRCGCKPRAQVLRELQVLLPWATHGLSRPKVLRHA